MVERRNRPFSFTIYFYAARGRIARVIAVRQPSGRNTLFTVRDFFGMSFSLWCIRGRLCRARSEMENDPVCCPRGWRIVIEEGSSVDLTGDVLGQENSRCVWLRLSKQAPRSPFSWIFSSSSATQPSFILPFAPWCAIATGAIEP